MNVKVNDVFSLSTGKYIALLEKEMDSNRYIFTNKLTDAEEPTQEFVVFKCTEEGLLEEKDKTVLAPLLDYFTKEVNDRLLEVNLAMDEDGEE